MDKRLRLDLPLLLPEVPDDRDACVRRLVEMVSGRPGVVKAHVALGEGEAGGDGEANDGRSGLDAGVPRLCIHYDPARLSLGQVEALARSAGAEITTRGGLSGIGLIVIVHEGSTLVVIANALRLLAFQGHEPAQPPER